MHKVTARLVDNLKEAAQYPLRNRAHDSELSHKDTKHVKKFAGDMETHHVDRAYQHHMDSEQFPKGSDAYHAHHVAADANNDAAEHYAKLAKNPKYMHDFHGGKRMKDVTHARKYFIRCMHMTEAEAYYDWNG